jgi:hypothetical protein
LVALNQFRVLDALIRSVNERRKQGLEDPRVPYTMLLNRILKEYDEVKESSARPQTSKLLNRLLDDGKICKEKIGRRVFYDATSKGRRFHLSNRDMVDYNRGWIEEVAQGMYFSVAFTPPKFGLIHERRGHNSRLKGKEILEEAVNKVKKENPNIDSIFIRIDNEE